MTWQVTDTVIDPATTVTRITYPAGETGSLGTVVGTARIGHAGVGMLGIILDTTAAHPLSPTWPDQPADRGTMKTPTGDAALVDVRQGVLREGELTVDVPGTRVEGDEVVVHLVDATTTVSIGERMEVTVDAPWRNALSAAHSACHLSALALDAALASCWTKPVALDSLGHPAFDQLAIQSSTLHPYRSVDVYRLGKSLRKKGFDVARLADGLEAITLAHADTLARWVVQDAPSSVAFSDGTLSERRSWWSMLDDVDVRIPCGGTHVSSTGALTGISSTVQLNDSRDELTVTTMIPQAAHQV